MKQNFGIPSPQLTVIPAGCQPWSTNVVCSAVRPEQDQNQGQQEVPAAQFAYCSTLAIYLFDYYPARPTSRLPTEVGRTTPDPFEHISPTHTGSFRLTKVLAEFEVNTTAIAWSVDQNQASLNTQFCSVHRNPSRINEIAIATADLQIHICSIVAARNMEIVTSFKTAERVKRMAFSPYHPDILLFQEDPKHLRFQSPTFQTTLSHDVDITVFEWHPKMVRFHFAKISSKFVA